MGEGGVHRSEGLEIEEGKKGDSVRIQDEYFGIVKKNTELFSSHRAEALLGKLVEFGEKKNVEFKLAPNKYKLYFKYMSGPDVELEINCKILKAGEKNVVDVNRVNGDAIFFFEQFMVIKDYIGDLIDESS